MARLNPQLIQQGETSTLKKVKHKGYTSFANINALMGLGETQGNLEQLTHRHEFVVYEDDTVEILPSLVITAFPDDTELTAAEQKAEMSRRGDESHTHDYIGYWPNGIIVENQISGILHKHKILGIPEKIQLIQPMYKQNDLKRRVNTNFEELFQSSKSNKMSIPKFFKHYSQLFYDIPKEGEDSHTRIIAESTGYLTNYIDPSQEEIQELTLQIVELEKKLAEKDSLDKEHPIFQNGSFIKHADNPTIYYMDKGQKRGIADWETYLVLKRVNGHEPDKPDEEVYILVTEDVIKGLETGPKFRSEDLYGDEEKRKVEEERKLIQLDPDDFIADPSNYETVEDYLVALDRETRQLLAKEEYLQELYIRYRYDSENISDSDTAKEAKISSRTYGTRLTKLRKQILRYTAILESVDPDGNLQNLEIDKSKLKKLVETENARNSFTKAEMAQLGPKNNTIQRFLDTEKSPLLSSTEKPLSYNSDNNTGTGLDNAASAYLKAAGMGDAANMGAEEQPKSPPKEYTNNPTGLFKNHTNNDAIKAMRLGEKSSKGNWYWTFKINKDRKVFKGKETGLWTIYENKLKNPVTMNIAIKPNSRINWKQSEFEWAPMPGQFPGINSRVWEGKVIHKLKPKSIGLYSYQK